MSQENFVEFNKSFDTASDTNSGKAFFKKGKGCPFSHANADTIDYKNPDLLAKFISEGGRMLPSRITNVSAKYQRVLKKAIKHSRVLALLPFVISGK